MAPANSKLAKKKTRLPKTGSHRSTPIVKKSTQASGARKSLRLPNQSSVSLVPQLKSAQPSPTPLAPISQPARTKRKRSPDSEAEADELKDSRPAKQSRKDTPPSLEPSEEKFPKDSEVGARTDGPEDPPEQPQEPPLLSEKDSDSLQSLYKDVMSSELNQALKRTSSRRSIAQSETGSDRTQRSSNTNAVYRRKNLAAVKIHFHVEPPNNIETTIKDIVNAKCTEHRRAELNVVAKEFRDGCLKNVRAQSGEDDFINLLHLAIKALDHENICVHEKSAWRPELKPVVRQQSHFSSSFMADIQQQEVNDTSAPLPKRQQQNANQYMSPESSMTNAATPSANNSQESSTKPPPVPAIEKEDRSPIKTPHPDLSMGIYLDALISDLSQDLDEDKATELIDWLQTEMVQHESGGPLEPMLISVPAPRALDLAFPFAVVEGKAYSTDKQIFEAENQAAVSVACAHNILHRLDRMANRGAAAAKTQPRVLFSFTTQGPIHELWAHWTIVKAGVRIFESKLWDSWNGLVQERAEEFIIKLNSVCDWGTGPFMKSVVEGLGKVALQAVI